VRTFLNVADPDALEDMPAADDDDVPDVLFTSLVGSKGFGRARVHRRYEQQTLPAEPRCGHGR
jgi:hypothetical protein